MLAVNSSDWTNAQTDLSFAGCTDYFVGFVVLQLRYQKSESLVHSLSLENVAEYCQKIYFKKFNKNMFIQCQCKIHLPLKIIFRHKI